MAKKQTKKPIKKQTKKQTKQKNKKENIMLTTTSNNNEMKKLVIFIVIIVALFVAFYVISMFIDVKESETTPEADEATVIQYDEIILGTLLDQSSGDGNYYVLIANEDRQQGVYEVYKSGYSAKENALKIYTSDIDSPFNQKYKAEESNFDIEQISDLRIKGDTLIKVEDHQLVEYFEGQEDIINVLKSISEE